jgi:hypothetical protein
LGALLSGLLNKLGGPREIGMNEAIARDHLNGRDTDLSGSGVHHIFTGSGGRKTPF